MILIFYIIPSLQHSRSSMSSISIFLPGSESMENIHLQPFQLLFPRNSSNGRVRVPNQENNNNGRANRTPNPAVFPSLTHACVQVRCPGKRRFFLLQARHLLVNFGIQLVKKIDVIFSCSCSAFFKMAMIFPADTIDFAFFGAKPPAFTHCLDCSFVSGM